MKVVRGAKPDPVDFEDLDEGETFTKPDDDQIQIKTDESSGCCLASGELEYFSDDEKVVRVACEVRVV